MKRMLCGVAAALFALCLCAPARTAAADDPLLPEDILYDGVTLGKTAERTGADTWQVTLSLVLEDRAAAPCSLCVTDRAGSLFELSGPPVARLGGEQAPGEIITADGMISYTPPQDIPAGTVLLITYTLKLNYSKVLPGEYKNQPLSAGASLAFLQDPGGEVLAFPAPMADFALARLDVFYSLCEGANVRYTGEFGEMQGVFVCDRAPVPAFAWSLPSVIVKDGVTYTPDIPSSHYTRTGGNEDIAWRAVSHAQPALSGAHSLTFVYRMSPSSSPLVPDTGGEGFMAVSLVLFIISALLAGVLCFCRFPSDKRGKKR